DVMATIRLPWETPLPMQWDLGTRLLASAGALRGADKTALVLSLIPVLAVASPAERFTLDAGIGFALLSEHRFAQQDFGGPLQAALTLGATVGLHERVAVGYRFMHYSDAGAWGNGTIGADFHMIEFSWRF
ncbi:MAG TPA: acyloxyacyl hydrolase, partial [Burkholderiaceae bacterium]